MLKAGSVVGGAVSVAWDVVMDSNMTVEALMKGLEAEELCGRFDCSGGTFTLPKQCAQVVGALQMGAFADVEALDGRFAL